MRAVIVLHEAFGLNSYIDSLLPQLSGLGYLACAPNLFHRSGGATAAYERFDEEAYPLVSSYSDRKFLEDFEVVLGHLTAKGWNAGQLGVIGFSLGGRLAFLAATRYALGAAVSFYPPAVITPVAPKRYPSLLADARSLVTPWLGLFGDADRLIPGVDVEILRDVLHGASVPTAVVRYPGLGHGFHCPQQPTHDDAAATGAWQRAVTWIGRFTGPATASES